jgi:hypothetical protein
MTIRASDLMPMFTATNLADTTRVDYQDIWQRKNLVLATRAEDRGSLGEVYYVKSASRASELPGPDELMEWVQYVRNECPECQGEARSLSGNDIQRS